MQIKSQDHLQALIISTRRSRQPGTASRDRESASSDQLPVWKRVESEHTSVLCENSPLAASAFSHYKHLPPNRDLFLSLYSLLYSFRSCLLELPRVESGQFRTAITASKSRPALCTLLPLHLQPPQTTHMCRLTPSVVRGVFSVRSTFSLRVTPRQPICRFPYQRILENYAQLSVAAGLRTAS
jgi:hypothetical protein